MNNIDTVEFLGKALTVITTNTQQLVAMRPICEAIGLNWKAQYNRIQRDEVLSEGVVVMTIPSAGGDQRATCLPLELLNGWLFGVETKRCQQAIRPALIRYKRECYAALAAHWQKKAEPQPGALPPPTEPTTLNLAYADRRLRILTLDGQPWFVAAEIAQALGLRDSHVILRRVPAQHRQKQMVGKQLLNIIKLPALRQAILMAKPEYAQPFSQWLDQALKFHVPAALPAPAKPAADPSSLLRGMLAGNRFMCQLDGEGRITLREIPSDHITIAVGQIPNWVADPCGARQDQLPKILQAISQRMGGRA